MVELQGRYRTWLYACDSGRTFPVDRRFPNNLLAIATSIMLLWRTRMSHGVKAALSMSGSWKICWKTAWKTN